MVGRQALGSLGFVGADFSGSDSVDIGAFSLRVDLAASALLLSFSKVLLIDDDCRVAVPNSQLMNCCMPMGDDAIVAFCNIKL